MSKLEQYLQQIVPRQLVYALIPAMMGVLMLGASFLPWLKDPLAETYTAWNVPLDMSWQFRNGLCNYGLLCVVCAALAFFVAYRQWNVQKKGLTP